MEVTHVGATIRNPAAPERSWQSSFLVDTGAIDSLVPCDQHERSLADLIAPRGA